MSRRRKHRDIDDEPEPEGEEWEEFGGELYWVVGHTAGGAPYGLTFDEMRAAAAQEPHAPGWARALQLLVWATAPGGDSRHIGRVTKIGDGLSRDVYTAMATIDLQDVACAVLLPRRGADPALKARTYRESRLLRFLSTANLPVRVPRPLAVLPTPTGPALVRECLAGMPVDLRAGRMQRIRPWEVVAEAAAAVHTVDTAELGWLGQPTRRTHAEAILEDLGDPDPADLPVHDALEWLWGHLPPDAPSTLVHGDLLGQNILWYPDEPLGLIDWEYATLGDPAYDLAITTRGVRKPFQVANGFERLLASYNERAKLPLQPRDVRFHELCLLLRWHQNEQLESVQSSYLRQIENLLARVAGT